MLPSSVAERIGRLAPDQRAAATAPPGPVLCVAPAGSGKTTTLVARIAWLVATGTDPAGITAVTFNKRAADEMRARVDQALEPLALPPGSVRVRTFHALGREILAEAGHAVEPLLDREAVLRDIWPDITRGALRRLDDAFSRLKLDVGVTATEVATDPDPGPVVRAFLAYETALRDSGGLDFDDLVGRALRLLEADTQLLRAWRERCSNLLVDETQDVDRSQLRLALLLAAPANCIFLVGDDDQTIYGWRLADVRRVLGLSASLPGVRRIDLTVNYRCPPAVVERAVRLVSRNEERFEKTISAGPVAAGRLILARDASDDWVRLERAIRSWPDDGGTRAILARTNAELLPAATVAVKMGLPFKAPRLRLLTEDLRVDALLAEIASRIGEPAAGRPNPSAPTAGAFPSGAGFPREEARDPASAFLPQLVALARSGLARTLDQGLAARPTSGPDMDRPEPEDQLPLETEDLVAALVGWASAYHDLGEMQAAVCAQRARLAELRRDDAPLTLATAHSTKGLEFDHVLVLGMDAGRFPSARSLRESTEPVRALEEERRLAYVAWTRARQSLTLVYDPEAPSPFLHEAFTAAELGVAPAPARATPESQTRSSAYLP
jgi:DNA helicase-2/ATP-dependent DNA helicase PcrA